MIYTRDRILQRIEEIQSSRVLCLVASGQPDSRRYFLDGMLTALVEVLEEEKETQASILRETFQQALESYQNTGDYSRLPEAMKAIIDKELAGLV